MEKRLRSIAGFDDVVFINVHMLTSHGPSCLCRDDNNMLKDAYVGGARRIRISSQCGKSAARMSAMYIEEFGADKRSVRTADLENAVKFLKARPALSALDPRIIEFVIASTMKKKTLVALVPAEMENLCLAVDVFLKKYGKTADEVALPGLEASSDESSENESENIEETVDNDDGKKKGKKDKEDAFGKFAKVVFAKSGKDKPVTGADLINILKDIGRKSLESGISAVDVALSGRMCAQSKTGNILQSVEAAMSMSHPYTTHEADTDIDWFVGKDDLAESSGAAHLNTQEFGAGTFYKHFAINLAQLAENLGKTAKDKSELLDIVAKQIKIMAHVSPSGKQNAFSAYDVASYVRVSFSRQPLSLENAFERPVERDDNGGYMIPSILALDEYREKIQKAYGIDEKSAVFSLHNDKRAKNGDAESFDSLPEILNWVRKQA